MASGRTGGGPRIVADAPWAPRAAEGFARRALRTPQLAELLSGHRWRLLQVVPFEEWDEAVRRFVTAEYEAVIYDYSRDLTVRARGAASGRGGLHVQMAYEQPTP